MDTAMLIGSFIPILAILFGGLIVLVPVLGLTIRFALKPAIEAFQQLRSAQGDGRELAVLEQRTSLLEQQLNQVESALHRLESAQEFDRRLIEGAERKPRIAAEGQSHVPAVYAPDA
jgi:hypothetical protein